MAWRAPGFDPVRSIGSGATGSVIVSRDAITGTEVAVKYLSKEVLRTAGFAEDFPREVNILAGIEHPNLVQLYEYVEGPGTGAVVMELVRGTSLRTLLAKLPLEPQAAFYVIKSALLGLTMTHRSRIVHRDFRPENVLITFDGVAKVADVGLAVRSRRHSLQPGDPRYMAPERWAGLPATPASDVFAVAATLFESLTGQTPRTKDKTYLGAAGLTDDDTIAQLLPTGLPGRVGKLLVRELAHQPERRSSHANIMLDELEVAALDAYGPNWEDTGRAQLVRQLARSHPQVAAPAIRTVPEPMPTPLPVALPASTAPTSTAPTSTAPTSTAPATGASATTAPSAPAAKPRSAPPTRAASPVDSIAFYAPGTAAAAVAPMNPTISAAPAPAASTASNADDASVSDTPPAATTALAPIRRAGTGSATRDNIQRVSAANANASTIIAAVLAAEAAAKATPADPPTDPPAKAPAGFGEDNRAAGGFGRRARILTAVVVTFALGAGVLAVTSGWLSGSDRNSRSGPTVPNFTHSAILVPGPAIPTPSTSGDSSQPTQPNGVHVISRSQTAVSLDWNASADNVGVVGYIIARDGKTVGTSYDPGFTDTGLTANHQYHYSVAAFDKAGNRSKVSAAIPAITLVGPDTAPPTIPTSLRSTTQSQTTIMLVWSSSHDNIGVAGYDVFRDGRQIASVTKTSYTDRGLAVRSTHTYFIRAYDSSNNESGSSRSISVSTLAKPDTTAPSVPGGLKMVTRTNSSITISWNKSTDAHGISGYQVARDGLVFPQTTLTTFTDNGLAAGHTYSYKVRAIDGSGNKSAYASAVRLTTMSAPTPTPTGAPTPTPTDTSTPTDTPTPTPVVGSIDGLSVSVSTPSDPDCKITVTADVHVSDAPVSGDGVAWSGDVGSGSTSATTYDVGDNTVTIGPFAVSAPGTITVSLGGFNATGSWDVSACTIAPSPSDTGGTTP